jgi:hypothetical protein
MIDLVMLPKPRFTSRLTASIHHSVSRRGEADIDPIIWSASHSILKRERGLSAQAENAGAPAARKIIRQERCRVSGTSLSLSAMRPSSGSDPACIFCIARLRWTFTVASAMPISWAICLLRRPRAT